MSRNIISALRTYNAVGAAPLVRHRAARLVEWQRWMWEPCRSQPRSVTMNERAHDVSFAGGMPEMDDRYLVPAGCH